MTLVLASTSETRRRLLADAGVTFDVRSPDIDEEALKASMLGGGAAPMAAALAEAKALGPGADARLVLGSDQVLEREDGSILGKPGSRQEAAEQLNGLAGRTHQLHSAAALASGGVIRWRAMESVSLRMRRFSPAFLETYLDIEYEAVRFNVGAYRIEGMGAQLFDDIQGSHFAILGLPLIPLLAELRRRSILAS